MPFILLSDSGGVEASNLSPGANATDADIGPIELVWTPTDVDDPLDPDEFTVSRDGIPYPVTAIALGDGAYRVIADVGLFPDESAIIIASATTVTGATDSITWSLTTRTGTPGDLGEAEVSNGVNVSGPVRASLRSLDSGLPTFTLVEIGQVLGVSYVVNAHLQPAFVTAGADIAEVYLVDFEEAGGETALARFSHAAQFIIAAMQSLLVGQPFVIESINAETADGFTPMATWPNSSRIGGETVGDGLRTALDQFEAVLSPGSNTVTAGPEQRDLATGALEAIPGSGVDTIFDIEDPILDTLNDE